jgi:hypothetical protein
MSMKNKICLFALFLLMTGCKDNLNPVDTSIYYHTVTLVSTSAQFQSTVVTYQVGTDKGDMPVGSKTFYSVVPGTIVSLTVTGTNPPSSIVTQQPPPGLVSATIYVDNAKWQTSNGAGQLNASATASGVIP